MIIFLDLFSLTISLFFFCIQLIFLFKFLITYNIIYLKDITVFKVDLVGQSISQLLKLSTINLSSFLPQKDSLSLFRDLFPFLGFLSKILQLFLRLTLLCNHWYNLFSGDAFILHLVVLVCK